MINWFNNMPLLILSIAIMAGGVLLSFVLFYLSTRYERQMQYRGLNGDKKRKAEACHIWGILIYFLVILPAFILFLMQMV